jgi:hypothetical protein
MVKDGAVPELARGSYLRGVGLLADCLEIVSAPSLADGLRELADAGEEAPGSFGYQLTGVAGAVQDVRDGHGYAGSEFVISAGDQAFIARTDTPVSQVGAGSRVTVRCTLSVVADYEWDAFGLPDLRTDWYVRGLKIEHRRAGGVPRQPGPPVGDYPGKVLGCYDIERMRRWDDDRDPGIRVRYLLDLVPLPAA